MNTLYVPKVDRRTAIAWIGAVGAATGAGVIVAGCSPQEKPAKGYGTDPNLVKPAAAPWPRLLSKNELQACAVLCDYILPASGGAPAATALGVPDFIDEWVSAPYPDQLKDRTIIRDGLKKLVRPLVKGDAAERAAALAAVPKATDEAGKVFFRRFRALTLGAYYTTEAGFKDIGYIGNESRASDPGPSPEVIAAVEAQLKALKL